VLVTGHPKAPIPSDVTIGLAVGPEVLTGSTRLKAGTATKLVLNMLTLGVMVRLGKTYGNLMVDVRPTSRKLSARAVGIIRSLTGCSERIAAKALRASGGRVKAAVLMLKERLSYPQALRGLAQAGGSLRLALHPVMGPRQTAPRTDSHRRARGGRGGDEMMPVR
jgi:N-acetylmuramic acid 6-phosphate etherase